MCSVRLCLFLKELSLPSFVVAPADGTGWDLDPVRFEGVSRPLLLPASFNPMVLDVGFSDREAYMIAVSTFGRNKREN